MRKKIFALIVSMLFAAMMLNGCADKNENKLADGKYLVSVEMEGGSGKAYVESPASLTVSDGKMTATLIWSSPNYDYMLIEGEKYLPVNTDGNSVFEVPVQKLDEPLLMIADTTAMSKPHEIEYTFIFNSDMIQKEN